MTAKEYLQRYRESVLDTQNAIAHIQELREMSIDLKDEHGQRIALDKAVANLVDAQEQTASELQRYCRLRAEIRRTIAFVPDAKLRMLLHKRYIQGLKWEQIAVDMNYDYSYVVHNLHSKALQLVKVPIEFNCANVVQLECEKATERL